MNNSAKSDDRGWSYADHYNKGLDEGGPAGPPFPANPAENRKAQAAFRWRRQKESYGNLTRHILAADIVDVLSRDHFQVGNVVFRGARRGTGRPRRHPRFLFSRQFTQDNNTRGHTGCAHTKCECTSVGSDESKSPMYYNGSHVQKAGCPWPWGY